VARLKTRTARGLEFSPGIILLHITLLHLTFK
jgi:hypothetical protein